MSHAPQHCRAPRKHRWPQEKRALGSLKRRVEEWRRRVLGHAESRVAGVSQRGGSVRLLGRLAPEHKVRVLDRRVFISVGTLVEPPREKEVAEDELGWRVGEKTNGPCAERCVHEGEACCVATLPPQATHGWNQGLCRDPAQPDVVLKGVAP